MSKTINITSQEALEYHMENTPGKISITPTKPLVSQKDLSLAYSPGVAYPCLEIAKNPQKAYDYTAKGNMVAVISNGTAVLGLGNLGALASKPVMEGKAVLFKKFADIDAVDLEVNTSNPDEFINCVRFLGESWGGINLEDIKAPECFIIEEQLRKHLNIPVFHDDQHGTAIIVLAGLINATHITGRKLESLKVVINGAGAAGIACAELIISDGVKAENVILCDTNGIIYQGRPEGMNKWKETYAVKTNKRTLSEALEGADVFIGLSVKGALTKDMVKLMNPKPIIFALANPDPEITPEEVKSVCPDAIIATGRSDYNNQINNVMGFPYIFRGALDVEASTINNNMKIAAAKALALLAREPVPAEVISVYSGKKLQYGPDYIIPVPFDFRLMTSISSAVAQAAMHSGLARKPIVDMKAYKDQLEARLDPTWSSMSMIYEKIRANPRKIIFSEGEEESIIRAAVLWRDNGYGTPILVGREKQIMEAVFHIYGKDNLEGIEICNAVKIPQERLEYYINFLYSKLQRNGYLYRDCVRMVKNARNIFASCILACGDGDALVTGVTRGYNIALDEVKQVINVKPNSRLFGMSIIVVNGKSYFVSDTTVNELPTAEELADIAIQTAHKAEALGHKAHVAMLSFSNFGNPARSKTERIREAMKILDSRDTGFEYDGEMSADVALNPELMKNYPFCRLSKPANVLIMPGLHSANISSKLLQTLAGGTVIGPILLGLEKPVQIIQMGTGVYDILNIAAYAAVESIDQKKMVRMPHWPVPLAKIPTDQTFSKFRQLMKELNINQDNLPKIIHIAGSDGKGSTQAFLANILCISGAKVHSYTSPHLIRFNERIKLLGKEINDQFLFEVTEQARLATEKLNLELNFFEGTTLAAFIAFSKVPADYLILETGVGGLFDPTNIIEKKILTIITSISMDHTNVLGNNLISIAMHKAGIMRPHTPCIISSQYEEVSEYLNDQAELNEVPTYQFEYDWLVEKNEEGLKFSFFDQVWQLPAPSLIGDHQYLNAGNAICASLVLSNFTLTQQQIAKALTTTFWPARLQKLVNGPILELFPENYQLWVDGAHNNAGANALAEWIKCNTIKNCYLVAGITKGRDCLSFLGNFSGVITKLIGVTVENEPSSYSGEYVASFGQQLSISSIGFSSLNEVFDYLKTLSPQPTLIIFCGSLYLAGDVLHRNKSFVLTC